MWQTRYTATLYVYVCLKTTGRTVALYVVTLCCSRDYRNYQGVRYENGKHTFFSLHTAWLMAIVFTPAVLVLAGDERAAVASHFYTTSTCVDIELLLDSDLAEGLVSRTF